MLPTITLVECPRDAMQGWAHFIPTSQKIAYLNKLLRVGFHTLDCGSFVSAKAIPQMADTSEVLAGLDLSNTKTQLLTIVANERGAAKAVEFKEITYLGFPFSISPTFQLRNTNSTINESWERVQAIQNLCLQHGKQLVIYISMGFGNPYGDDYNIDLVMKWVEEMAGIGVKIISLADTVGLATPLQVQEITGAVVPLYPNVQIGVHLHSTAFNWQQKIDAALAAGCLRFDGALKGIGGCPMAGDELVGNMDTALMIPYFQSKNLLSPINEEALQEALQMAGEIFV
jgi:hydroxymethylglutaryl-CoA lyase